MAEKKATPESVYAKLNAIPFKDKVEKKGYISYLSWAHAWDMLKNAYPRAERTVYEDPSTGFNYFTDGRFAWVKVGVTIDGLEHIDYLPIMDNRNQSIPIEKVNQFEVNKSIQRSTTKAIAMHGLGIQLWTGEDLQESPKQEPAPLPKDLQESPKQEPAPLPKEKMTLEVDDENWDKVLIYVGKNYNQGITKILGQLRRKYTVGKDAQAELKQFIEFAKQQEEESKQ